ncbi:MAG: ABC-F family ATP-binding cassette domain-containing protein [Aerococcus sp.]|nr:ABC-F family ATP-binding cassette domain-containing protein [Aerococcus sp.]
MILLQGNHLERRFGSEVLFSDISLSIQDNSRIALVGRNGVGKSTLLKMIAGEEAPDEGDISRAKQMRLAYMDQHATVDSIDPTRTVYEEVESAFDDVKQLLTQAEDVSNQMAALSENPESEAFQEALNTYDRIQETLARRNAYSYESEIRMVLNGFQFPPEMWDQHVRDLSGGQRTRLALAKVLLEKCDLLILDEPTNHLDIDTLTWLENYLKSYPGALLIVSHDRYFLDKVTNETLEMSHSGLERYAGNYSFYLKERQVRLASAEKAYEKQQKEIAKLEDYVSRNLVRASTTKMAQSRRKQLEKMTKIEKPKQDEKSPYIRFYADKTSGNVVIHTDNLAIGYDGDIVSAPINLDLRKQNAIAIVGPNGIGKSTLLKTLIKRLPPIHGDITYGTNVEIGYYDQELGNLHSKKNVLHELWDEHPTYNEVIIRSLLGSFLFTGDDVMKPVAALSGGEKARLELAKLAMKHDNTLLLDEPTNHLDIDSKEVLENALINFDGTILFVSHDRYFINRIATAVLELDSDGSTLYLGDYDYYVAKKQEQAEREAALQEENGVEVSKQPVETTDTKQSYLDDKAKRKQDRKLKRDIEKLETHIDELEAKIQAVEAEMVEPANLNDTGKLNDLNTQLNDLKTEYDTTLDEWETKSLALDD